MNREPHTYDPETKRLNVDVMSVEVRPYPQPDPATGLPLWQICIRWSARRVTMEGVSSGSYRSILWEPEEEAHEIARREWAELLRHYQLADEEQDKALRAFHEVRRAD